MDRFYNLEKKLFWRHFNVTRARSELKMVQENQKIRQEHS